MMFSGHYPHLSALSVLSSIHPILWSSHNTKEIGTVQVNNEHPIQPAPPAPLTLHGEQQAQPTQYPQTPIHQEMPAQQPAITQTTAQHNGERLTSEDMQFSENVTKVLLDAFSQKVVGQNQLKTSLLVSLFTGGHILLESVPGLAKTTAAQSLADALDTTFKRIQCTPDLLPSDIIGSQVYDNRTNTFKTQLGPVHSNIVLLDEINRSSAKTQSAMLEAMQERQTSIGGENHKLPNPFLVLATQNPIEQEGTYRLPEAQLDRFLIKEILDYPTTQEELEIIEKIENGDLDSKKVFSTNITSAHILHMQNLAEKVYVDTKIKEYIVSIVEITRNPEEALGQKYAEMIEQGASPRATIAFLKASKALALMNGRDHVLPEDIKAIGHRILRHRIVLNYVAVSSGITTETIIDGIFNSVGIL